MQSNFLNALHATIPLNSNVFNFHFSERLHLEEKLDEYKFLSPDEEKQIVELDESVEAIDAAIDYKNDLLRQVDS